MNALVVDCVRTPLGKYAGALSKVRPDDLAGLVIKKIIERNNIDPYSIDEIIFGCASGCGEDSRNVARNAILATDLPPEIPAFTVNRLCASGLQAVILGFSLIENGFAKIILAGGVESMSRAPYVFAKMETPFQAGNFTVYDSALGWRFVNPRFLEKYKPLSMGVTAEVLYEKYKISREKQDLFALESHQKVCSAYKKGFFKEELIPVEYTDKKIGTVKVEKDEGPREDTSLEKLAKLPPVFKKDGTVTAGNSCPMSDGAACTLIVEENIAKKMGYSFGLKLIKAVSIGTHPDYMGLGPVYSTKKLLKELNISLDKIDLIEINEAFAVQVLACLQELNLSENRINPQGGAIALGHPLGCTGARMVCSAFYQMKRENYKNALLTLCVGAGQGTSAYFEKVKL
jgi:acetyl-CoA acetyltransferase family protein